MPEYIWNIGFAVSLFFSVSFSLGVGRKVFKAGVEHFSSRILILSSIVDASLCGLLFLFQGINELGRIIASTSFSPGQAIVPIIFFAVPCKIIWNYFAIQRKLIARFNLLPHDSEAFTAIASSLSKTMSISVPTILSSEAVSTPFVFGLRSSKAILAVPKSWQRIDRAQQHVLLLHELGHIRNHDVGFLAWSNACIQDLRLLLAILPTLIVYCYAFGFESIAPSIYTYLACSLILYVLLRYVVRKRELLADMTAALLIESSKVCELISEQQLPAIVSSITSGQATKPKLADKTQRWFTDKALFSKRKKIWKLALRISTFAHSFHPTKPERVGTVRSQSDLSQRPGSSFAGSFWAGVAIGLLGVIIALSGYWFAVSVQTPQEDVDVLLLPLQMYGMISPIPLGFLSIFLALPAWSSLKKPILNKQFLLSLLARYGVALVGACLISPLILAAGITLLDIRVLLARCIIWFAVIMVFGFGFNIIAVFLWIRIRYFQLSQVAELIKSLWMLGIFIVVMFCLILIGGVLLTKGMVFCADNTICSTMIGAALILPVAYSRFSETEQYSIVIVPFATHRVEGKWFKPAWALHSFYITGLFFLFTSLMFVGVHLTFGHLLRDLGSTAGIFGSGIICCIVLILVERRSPNRIREAKRRKIYPLWHCLKLLLEPLNSQAHEKLRKVAESYDLRRIGAKNLHTLNLTVNDVNELVVLISNDPTQDDKRAQALEWLLACETDGGFGIWPGSAARLQSTCQALSILQDLNELDRCQRDSHVQWIKERQQSNGSFKGPWSKRPAWESTFYAVKSLDILKSALDPSKAQTCRDWCSDVLINEGTKKNRPDVVHYCFGVLDCLGEINANILEPVSNWLLFKIDELLLTNVALDYENVHFAVMTYHLLGMQNAMISKEDNMTLLAQRIQISLEAELLDIRLNQNRKGRFIGFSKQP